MGKYELIKNVRKKLVSAQKRYQREIRIYENDSDNIKIQLDNTIDLTNLVVKCFGKSASFIFCISSVDITELAMDTVSMFFNKSVFSILYLLIYFMLFVYKCMVKCCFLWYSGE